MVLAATLPPTGLQPMNGLVWQSPIIEIGVIQIAAVVKFGLVMDQQHLHLIGG